MPAAVSHCDIHMYICANVTFFFFFGRKDDFYELPASCRLQPPQLSCPNCSGHHSQQGKYLSFQLVHLNLVILQITHREQPHKRVN